METKTPKLLYLNVVVSVLKAKKKRYLVVMPIVLIGTYLLTLFVPRYYKCSVMLAPENDLPISGGALSSAMSSLGLGSASLPTSDAISPALYPDLLESNDFIIQLFPEKVTTKNDLLTTNYYDYLANHQKQAWWNALIGYVIESLNPTPKSSYNGTGEINVMSMSKRELNIAGIIKGNITCSVDQKTGAVSITVKDQDPHVCATIANATLQHIQKFIIDYRTNKARNDVAYYKKLNEEAKNNYEKARLQYASYYDANTNPNLAWVRTKVEDLENDMQLKYNVYTSTTNQLQNAIHKIQERTPAFTVLQSAIIPYRPAGPKRTFIAIGMMIAVFIGMSAYYLRRYIC